jgi:hypothetical protein
MTLWSRWLEPNGSHPEPVEQVNLHPNDEKKTAFSTGQGLWKFTVIPFGQCNAPSKFKSLMETCELCLRYLDDVIVIDRTFQEHLLNLRKVFQRFREARLNPNP